MVQELRVRRVGPAYEQVAGELRALIVSGELPLGAQLPTEPALCTLFGVSRSTVREALRVLSSQQLVVTLRGVSGGTFVATPQATTVSDNLATSLGLLADANEVDVDQLLEVREALEVPAARFAAARRNEADLTALRVALEAGRDGNQTFHELIVAASANPLLGLVARPVFAVLRERFLRDQAPQTFWTTVRRDHTTILTAIEAGDGEQAALHMREHLSRLASTYRRIDRKARA